MLYGGDLASLKPKGFFNFSPNFFTSQASVRWLCVLGCGTRLNYGVALENNAESTPYTKLGCETSATKLNRWKTRQGRKCMSQKDFQIFQDYARDRQEVKDLLAWYNSLPDLTESEIWETVGTNERKDTDTIESYYVKTIVTIRAYSELIIEDEKTREERIATFHRVSDNIDTLLQFSKWQKAYKKAK